MTHEEEVERLRLAAVYDYPAEPSRERPEKWADIKAERDALRESAGEWASRYTQARAALARVEAVVSPQWRSVPSDIPDSPIEAFSAGRNWLIDQVRGAMSGATAPQGDPNPDHPLWGYRAANRPETAPQGEAREARAEAERRYVPDITPDEDTREAMWAAQGAFVAGAEWAAARAAADERDVEVVARAVREHKTEWRGDWPKGHYCWTCAEDVDHDHQERMVLAALRPDAAPQPERVECGDWPAPCNHDPAHPRPQQ